MDVTSPASNSSTSVSVLGSSPDVFMCVVVAFVVLPMEIQRRGGLGLGLHGGRYADGAKQLLQRCAPEALLLLSCLTLAALLRAQGGTTTAHEVADAEEAEAWELITNEWPLLVTADTLLAFQAMLRLVALLSALLRGRGAAAPLGGEAAALWLIAGLGRVALLSQSHMYMLDGPLGGRLPVALELLSLPALLFLGRRALRSRLLPLAAAAAGLWASRNHLALAEGDSLADSIFMFVQVMDLFAALAYLGRAALLERDAGDVSVGFTHLLMPVQAGCAAYFFLQAFTEVPELVGAGRPFETLQIGNAAALGAYLGASALFAADVIDGQPAR